MIDIRYHIYSLAAVFFALAVGIVIGTSFAKRSPAAEVERQTISRYEKTMHQLKREIELASDEAIANEKIAKESAEFLEAVLPIVVKDRLAWRNVAIVQTGDYDDLTGSIKRVLEEAGATVTSVTDVSRTFAFDDHQKVTTALEACGVSPPKDAKEARDKLFNILAETLYGAKYSYMLSELEEAGVGTFTGDYNRFNKLIVLVGGSNSKKTNTSQSVDAQLISQFSQPDAVVVGCESIGAESSYVPIWKKMGIATVDNADSAVGQIALICALNGERACFGKKETADRLVPQSLETN